MTKPLPTTEEALAWIDKKVMSAQANIKIYEVENLQAIRWLEEYPDNGTGKYRAEYTPVSYTHLTLPTNREV